MFEFDDCFYDQPSMVHDRQELIEFRKIETIMLPMTQEKTTLFAPMSMHIDFVIPDKFYIDECRNFLSLVLPEAIQELQDMPNTKILILHHFKIRGRVFSNRCLQVSISMSLNLGDKIHLEGRGNVMTWVLNKLFEFR